MDLDLKGMKEKAKSLLIKAQPYATRPTLGYDAAKNKVIVAGYPLDGVISASLSADTLLKQEVGIDYRYTAIHEVFTQRTLTVTILPTASCLDILRVLALKQLESKGWFNISVHENDKIVNVYRGWIIELPEIAMQQEANDRQVIFGIKQMFTSLAVIDQPTDTESETYSRYGIDPSKAFGEEERMVIDENSGGVVSYPIVNPNPPLPEVEVPVDPNIPITPIE